MAMKPSKTQLAAAVLLIIAAVIDAAFLMWSLLEGHRNVPAILLGTVAFAALVFAAFWYIAGPDRIRSTTTDQMLKLASDMLSAMEGEMLTADSAQRICDMLLSNSRGVAVAITDRVNILGYSGVSEDGRNPAGSAIRTLATKETLSDGETRVMLSAQEIGFKDEVRAIGAAIIVPLHISNAVVGTLKFYYAHAHFINDTEKSIAEGFGKILSTQMAAAALESQKKHAASMELRALQTQINPHFLFNTLNTIAALIRTDPDKARVMLREFAKFYRKTLENEGDLIELEREVEQTQRYFGFELARFGEDMLELQVDIPEELNDVPIPSFMLQPIVENAVRHARRADCKLTVKILARAVGDDLRIEVSDDGVGMSEEVCQNILHPKSDTGLGIAVNNINERVTGYFGTESSMRFESELGRGTTVALFLKDALVRECE